MTLLNLQDYAEDIDLYQEFNPATPELTADEREQVVNELLQEVKPVLKQAGYPDPGLYLESRQLLRAAINMLQPGFFKDGSIVKLDGLLQAELREQHIVRVTELDQSSAMEIGGTRVILWQGDITTLEIGAVVNAANNRLLGCFQPLHNCIDNVIHSKAGVQLRDDCYKIMKRQKIPEATGHAKVTRAYNLPSQFVIHTVGPIVEAGLQPQHRRDLKNTYLSCLDVTKEIDRIESIAFCCISTGVFGYPQEAAAETAFHTVCGWLGSNPGVLAQVVFNVFTEQDKLIYQAIMERL